MPTYFDIPACLPCPPCDDGSGSGGSGSGGGPFPGTLYADATSCNSGDCSGYVGDPALSTFSPTIPLCYCFTFPAVLPGTCDAWEDRTCQIDNDFSGTYPTITTSCVWFGNNTDRDAPTNTDFYPDYDPGVCTASINYGLAWGCDADMPAAVGYIFKITIATVGVAKYVCPSTSTTPLSTITLSLVSDTTGYSFPASITLSPCAPDGFNKI